MSKFRNDPTVNEYVIIVLMGQGLRISKKKITFWEGKKEEHIWEEEKA